mmetsp:Transcript_12563/g.28382  ORF Transcript_12563/g.28382 Transcript_12563/m.28382 type:complete len:274 (-) Transcript_12563:1025-1846(-)
MMFVLELSYPLGLLFDLSFRLLQRGLHCQNPLRLLLGPRYACLLLGCIPSGLFRCCFCLCCPVLCIELCIFCLSLCFCASFLCPLFCLSDSLLCLSCHLLSFSSNRLSGCLSLLSRLCFPKRGFTGLPHQILRFLLQQLPALLCGDRLLCSSRRLALCFPASFLRLSLRFEKHFRGDCLVRNATRLHCVSHTLRQHLELLVCEELWMLHQLSLAGYHPSSACCLLQQLQRLCEAAIGKQLGQMSPQVRQLCRHVLRPIIQTSLLRCLAKCFES